MDRTPQEAPSQTKSRLDGFVPDEQCSTCHEAIATTYRAHSMGRSLAAITDEFEMPGIDKASFEADGFRYSVVRENGRWVHRQARQTATGDETAVVQAEVSHVVGSGNHGRSFLVDRGGYLFMSPITWYPDKEFWHLSPGYEKKNSQFNRPVVEICLYCHSNGAPRIVDTLNQYHQPIFRGHAIGCQRCHGPGAEHVRRQEAGSDANESAIVNPASLRPDLREAVCQQCHLSGFTRVTKPGKHLYDYRPGQPLTSAYTVFMQTSTDKKFVGHVEQMHQSRCYQGSDRQLGCISCHDPHRLPSAAEKIDFYRNRCLDCHQGDACALPIDTRRATTAEDSCIVCHMSRQITEVRHAASTDHSIPRMTTSPQPVTEATFAIYAFPSNEIADPTRRDTAIAMARAGESVPEALRQRARQDLERALAQGQDDVDAMEALVDLYAAEGAIGKAIDVANRVLKQHPRREHTLTIVADIYSQLASHGKAIPFWRRAIDTNPHMSRYWYQLGLAYGKTNQWYVCRQTMSVAKQHFPTSVGVRQLLVESNLQLDDADAAAAEFRELERFRPAGLGALQDWYESATRNR